MKSNTIWLDICPSKSTTKPRKLRGFVFEGLKELKSGSFFVNIN